MYTLSQLRLKSNPHPPKKRKKKISNHINLLVNLTWQCRIFLPPVTKWVILLCPAGWIHLLLEQQQQSLWDIKFQGVLWKFSTAVMTVFTNNIYKESFRVMETRRWKLWINLPKCVLIFWMGKYNFFLSKSQSFLKFVSVP